MLTPVLVQLAKFTIQHYIQIRHKYNNYIDYLVGVFLLFDWLARGPQETIGPFLKRSPHKITIKLWIDLIRDVEV